MVTGQSSPVTWALVCPLPLSVAVEGTLNAGTQVGESSVLLRMMTEFLLRPESWNVTARRDSVMPGVTAWLWQCTGVTGNRV